MIHENNTRNTKAIICMEVLISLPFALLLDSITSGKFIEFVFLGKNLGKEDFRISLTRGKWSSSRVNMSEDSFQALPSSNNTIFFFN